MTSVGLPFPQTSPHGEGRGASYREPESREPARLFPDCSKNTALEMLRALRNSHSPFWKFTGHNGI